MSLYPHDDGLEDKGPSLGEGECWMEKEPNSTEHVVHQNLQISIEHSQLVKFVCKPQHSSEELDKAMSCIVEEATSGKEARPCKASKADLVYPHDDGFDDYESAPEEGGCWMEKESKTVKEITQVTTSG